ncbi:MAG: T9SS type A sorting domain-containing protein [Bacteroidia bacterium]|nr:T9SS type A sorting domain-containing protein [Bacteroidia bacterium]
MKKLLTYLLTALLICQGSLFAQATQIEFIQGIPTLAGKGLPIYIDVCATNAASTVDQAYAVNISVSNNGGVAFSSNPANTIAPTDGCVRFHITPSDTGSLNLSFSSGVFTNIVTGNIRVDSFAIPSTDMVGEIFYPGNEPSNIGIYQSLADTLNDAWERRIGRTCNDSVPSAFTPIFGDISFNGTTYIGEITNLSILSSDSLSSNPYTGTVTYKVVNMKGSEFASIKGEHHTSGLTFLSNAQVLQDSAPMPASLIPFGDNTRFTEVTGDFGSRNGLLFSFSPAVEQFGMFIGDVESNPSTTPGEFVLFNGDVELRRDTLPTRSSALEQSNAPFDCGSYPGCGNQGTSWVEFSGAPVTDLLIIVGDDNSAGFGGFGGTEHLSFVGASMGGDCLLSPQAIIQMNLKTSSINGKNQLSWTSPHETEGLVFEILKGSSPESLSTYSYLKANGGFNYQFEDPKVDSKTVYYRLKMYDKKGGIGFSEISKAEFIAVSDLYFLENIYTSGASLTIPLFSSNSQLGRVAVLDIHGRIIQSFAIDIHQGASDIKIPLSQISGGFYVLEVSSINSKIRKKIKL